VGLVPDYCNEVNTAIKKITGQVLVAHTCNSSYSRGKDEVQSQPGQIVGETLSQKYLTQKRAGGVAQVVEYPPSKCEALSSNSSTAKKKKKDNDHLNW
jgi:hypothetical protein